MSLIESVGEFDSSGSRTQGAAESLKLFRAEKHLSNYSMRQLNLEPKSVIS